MKASEIERSWINPINMQQDLSLALFHIKAIRLMGKHKPEYTPSIKNGDRVVYLKIYI